MVQTMIHRTVYMECIYASTGCGAVSSVQCNSETCKGEVSVEVPYVLSKIFCISINLACKQPLQLIWYIMNMQFYLSFSTTESRWLTFKSHRSTIPAVRNLSQNMVTFWQVMVDEVIRIISGFMAHVLIIDTVWLERTFCSHIRIELYVNMAITLHVYKLLSKSYLHHASVWSQNLRESLLCPILPLLQCHVDDLLHDVWK